MRWEGGEEDSIEQFLKCNNCVSEEGENTGQSCQSVEWIKTTSMIPRFYSAFDFPFLICCLVQSVVVGHQAIIQSPLALLKPPSIHD